MSLLFWYAAVPLQAILLYLLIRGRAYTVCPFFFSYSAFSVLAGVARFLTRNYAQAYKSTYWSTEAVYCILGIAAMYEVLGAILRTRPGWMRFVFPGIVALAIGLSMIHAHLVPPKLHGFQFFVITSEIAIRFVQIMVFLLVGVLAIAYGLRWYHLGVAAGFGLYSAVFLLTTIKISDLGMRFKFWWDMSSVAAYSLAILIWIWFFRVPPEKEPSPDLKLAARYIAQLSQHWSRARRLRKADTLAILH